MNDALVLLLVNLLLQYRYVYRFSDNDEVLSYTQSPTRNLSYSPTHPPAQAMTYNDISVLENMHISTLYQVLRSEGCDVFATLSETEWKAARRYGSNTIQYRQIMV